MNLLVRYGELALKSKPVRKRFELALVRNIKHALEDAEVKRGYGRIFVSTSPEKAPLLARVFGIVSSSPFESCTATIQAMTMLAEKLSHNFTGSFAVKTRRVGKHPFTSQQVNEHIGKAIASRGLKVNLSKPKHTLSIDIRDQTAYLSTERLAGPGGFPLGTQGTVAAVVKDKRDLLAAWLFLKKGCNVLLVNPKKLDTQALERWTFKPLPTFATLEETLKHKPRGIITSDPFHSKELPVYTPLLGLEDKEIKQMLKSL